MSLRNEIAKIVKAGLDDYFCEVVANEYDVTDQILALLEGELKGLDAVQDLINNSYGVAGLHLNGDVAPWDELLEGGRFEAWLKDFSRCGKKVEVKG
jgi:hypothetical protein